MWLIRYKDRNGFPHITYVQQELKPSTSEALEAIRNEVMGEKSSNLQSAAAATSLLIGLTIISIEQSTESDLY